MSEFKLPDVGEGLTEAEIVSWKVKVGDVIAINDIIVEIETAKSLVELPSPYAGTVLALMVAEGEMIEVGTPIISVGDPNEAPAAARRGGCPRPRWRSTCPTRAPPVVARARAWSVATRPTAAPIRRARKGAASPSSEAAANTQMQVQGAFSPGGAQSTDVVASDEPAVPGHLGAHPRAGAGLGVRPAPGGHAAARPGRWPSRRCASSPRTSGSTWPRAPRRGRTARSRAPTWRPLPGGAAHGGRRRSSASRPRRLRVVRCQWRAGDPRADQGRPQDDGLGDGRRRRSPPRTSPSGSPSTSRARWSSSSGSRSDASSVTSRCRRCSCCRAR